jgi:type IV secretory pathway VirD2 relaxase
MAILVKRSGYIKYRTVGKSRPLTAINRHLKYISADREKHRNKVELFTQSEDRADRKDFYQRIKDQKQHGVVAHKLILSLSEDERNKTGADLRELVRETMSTYEAKYKQQLDWIAAIHDDEGHPHCHIVIRGRGLDNKSVWIDTDRMKEMARIADRIKERSRERGWERKEMNFFQQLDEERHMYPVKREKERSIDFERER